MDAHLRDPWTEAQWTQVQETVRDEARRQRVAASFLPVDGPLEPHDQTANLQTLNVTAAGGPLAQGIDDYTTRRLTTLSVNVVLRHAQVVEPDLSAALVAFRRAANLIARAEDRLVFRGQPGPNPPLPGLVPCNATGGALFLGLLGEAALANPPIILGPGPNQFQLAAAVSQAIGILEGQGHHGPFAMVLGTSLFDLAYNPIPFSLVFAADRIKPLLDGPLLRSSTLNWFLGPLTFSFGIVVSLASNLLDLVVGSEIGVHPIQVTATASPRYVYRVSQRFTLRVKQRTAMVALTSW